MVKSRVKLEAVLAHAGCPKCGHPMHADDVARNRLTATCSGCRWFGDAILPSIQKTILYLDNSTLSHMVTAIARGDGNSPWRALLEALREAVHCNVICCPGSPVIDHESQLSERVSRAVRELSRSLGDVRLRHPSTVQERQLLRAFRRFLDNVPPETGYAPPFSDVSEDEPHDWLQFLQFSSLIHATPAELEQWRKSKLALRDDVSEIFKRYISEGLSVDQIRQREASGIGLALRRDGPLWPFLLVARERFDEEGAWQAVDKFMNSDHAANIPAADITSRLYAIVAGSFAANKNRRVPSPSDADDIQQIGTYLPYVDILITDSFFAQRANETAAGLDQYRGRVQRLGEKQIGEFIEWLNALVRNASHAVLAERIYAELSERGSFRQFTDRVGWTKPANG